MKNIENPTLISSTLKTVACENLIVDQELINAKDKPLEEVLNEAKEQETTKQGERE